MPWIYHQETGKLFHDQTYIGTGWAGHGKGKNKADWQNRKGVGPLPRGTYSIGPLFNYSGGTGPYSMRLTPDPNNQMFGRAGFLIHGASIDPKEYGQESNGCIVIRRSIRTQIGHSNDHTLEVVR